LVVGLVVAALSGLADCDRKLLGGSASGVAQVPTPAVTHQPGGDVEKRRAQSFAARSADCAGQRQGAQPSPDVVHRRGGLPVQPVTEERLHGGVDHPEVVFERPNGVFGDTAAQPVMGLDVGDDRVQPPAIKIVEGQLLTAPFGLAAHDQPHNAPLPRCDAALNP